VLYTQVTLNSLTQNTPFLLCFCNKYFFQNPHFEDMMGYFSLEDSPVMG